MAELNEKQIKMCEENKTDFSDLKALFLNCQKQLWKRTGCQ
jgi:hypothetical protein